MTYEETLAFLFERLPMFQRQGAAAIKPGLERIEKICSFLGNPHKNFKTIHVAGSNGKRSVPNMLAAVLMQAGYKVGLYTSPHFKDFRERIKINGKCIPKNVVCDFVSRVSDQSDLSPSFFEYSTAMAFEYFSAEKVDVAVIETGLGGRLDSTNVIDPLLSVVTSISLDHTEFLGSTITEIAREKAGIIKEARPVIVGDAPAEVLAVFEKFAAINSTKVFQAGSHPEFVPSISSPFKEDNQNIVYEACLQLRILDYDLSLKEIITGIESTVENLGFYGRWYQNEQLPRVFFDVAHNPAGIDYVLGKAKTLSSFNDWNIVFGAVRDKDLNSIVSKLPKEARYYLCAADVPRACPVDDLSEYFKKEKLSFETFSSVKEALTASKENAGNTRYTLVFGSFFVVAEALPEEIFEKFS